MPDKKKQLKHFLKTKKYEVNKCLTKKNQNKAWQFTGVLLCGGWLLFQFFDVHESLFTVVEHADIVFCASALDF